MPMIAASNAIGSENPFTHNYKLARMILHEALELSSADFIFQ